MPKAAAAKVQDRFKSPEELEAEADALMGAGPGPDDELDSPGNPNPPDSPDKPAPDAKGKKEAEPAPPASPSLGDTVQRLSETQRRMHEAITQANEMRGNNAQLTQTVQTLQTQLTTLQQEIATLRAQPAPSPSDSPVLATVMSDIDALSENYPSIATPLKAAIQALQRQNDALTSQLNAVRADLGKTGQELRATREHIDDTIVESQNAPILRAHPDAYQLVKDPAFQAWIKDRPTVDYMAVYGDPDRNNAGGDTETVIEILDAYKQSIGQARSVADAERDTTPSLRGGEGKRPASPNKPQGKMWTRAEISALDHRQYSPEKWAEIEKDFTSASAEGRMLD